MTARIYIGGENQTAGVDPLAISHDILVETRDAVDGLTIDDIAVSWFDKWRLGGRPHKESAPPAAPG